MKTRPVIPAEFVRNADGLPWSAGYADVYHPAVGAQSQARHVFIAGNGLPGRWRGRERFVVLETGFGLGNNFLATWQAWREDAQACERLHYIAVEKHPLRRDDLREAHRGSPTPDLAEALIEAWPTLTPTLHGLQFEGGRVRLSLAFGDVTDWLPELVAEVDAFYLDGFSPARNPEMWQPRLCKALARLAVREATLATWTAARGLREGLAAAGFDVRLGAGMGGKRDITLARYAPSFEPRRASSRSPRSGMRHAVIVGAGLAGCAAAWALAEEGWTSTVLDRRDAPARETSGNPAGLFHATLHAQDGPHARFNRAAAFEAARAARVAIERFGVPGQVDGLLRLAGGETLEAMRQLLADQALPADFVQALSAGQACEACGLDIDTPAWRYSDGGWISPSGLARAWLELAGDRVAFRGGASVGTLSRISGGWRLHAAGGQVLAEAELVVLAHAGEALRLLEGLDGSTWPTEQVRGQISIAQADASLRLPSLPIAGNGYLLPDVEGRMIFGATSQPGDDDPTVRDGDHAANLEQLRRLSPGFAGWAPDRLDGRVGWRLVTQDRLPLIGGVPDRSALTPRMDHPRHVPRLPGLFMFTALGSRGITWAALGARILASAVTGSPCPVEASLLEAVDAARFVSRALRRG